jgi:hypothetical protein
LLQELLTTPRDHGAYLPLIGVACGAIQEVTWTSDSGNAPEVSLKGYFGVCKGESVGILYGSYWRVRIVYNRVTL